MDNQIICFAKNEAALVFQSIGIRVNIIHDNDQLKEKLKELLNSNVYIILIDEKLRDGLADLIAAFDQKPYPITLFLPFEEEDTNNSIIEMKRKIAKAIGINII